MSDSVRPHSRQPTRLCHPWDSLGKNTGVGCHFLLQCMKVKSESEVSQSCPTVSEPMDCSLPGSSVHGIFQAGVLEWGAIRGLFSSLVNFNMLLLSTTSGVCVWFMVDSEKKYIKFKRLFKNISSRQIYRVHFGGRRILLISCYQVSIR